jgi:predicted esterase
MDVSCHKMRIKRTAHVYATGEISTAQNLWLVCHGYGQQADRLIQKFTGLDLSENIVLVPEGISKFYWNGFSGEPVASWMTRRHRLDEIEDYCDYLDQVLANWLEKKKFEKIILFGFSQGCATIWRWVQSRRPFFHVLLNWAGNVPEDISYLDLQIYLATKKLYMVYGKSDPYINDQRMHEIRNTIDKNKLNFNYRIFEGGHSIHPLALEKITNELRG